MREVSEQIDDNWIETTDGFGQERNRATHCGRGLRSLWCVLLQRMSQSKTHIADRGTECSTSASKTLEAYTKGVEGVHLFGHGEPYSPRKSTCSLSRATPTVDEAEYLGAPPVGVADPDVVMSVRGVDMNAHSVDGGIGRKGCKLACEFRLAVLLSESPASPSDSTQPLSSCRLWYEHL